MRYTITHYNNTNEAEACRAFLEWQGHSAEVAEQKASLKESRGKGTPVIRNPRGELQAVGMMELWRLWVEKGLFRC